VVVAFALGIFSAAALSGAVPSLAQLKPDAAGMETPFGRAPLSFADIIDKVKPAVVSISVVNGGKKLVSKGGRGFEMPDIPEGSPFYDFFKNLPKEFRGMPQQQPMEGQGSGFVISPDGYVVTNNHVIDGATKIQVSFDDQEKYEAELKGTDARTDLALLKIKGTKSFPHVKFSDKPARVGDWAIAVGNPFGLGGTVTAGIVSALARDIGSGPYDYMQTDAAVNKGNSGGPTFNLDGEVIGINTAIYSQSGGNVGIAFAVPAATAKEVVDQLINSGSVSRGWLGVKIQNIDDDTAASLGLKEAKGALVSDVTVDGPAASAGFKAQDAILAVNGEKITDSRELSRMIAKLTPNTTVDVKIWRIAKLEGEQPQDNDDNDEKKELQQLGLTLVPVRDAGGKEGVAIAEVDPESSAAQKGLKAGDVILEVDREAVSTPDDVISGVKKVKEKGLDAVLLHVRSGEQKRIVALRFPKG
jgi:serine protease Do